MDTYKYAAKTSKQSLPMHLYQSYVGFNLQQQQQHPKVVISKK